MMNFKIKINKVADVKQFNRICCSYPFDVDVVSSSYFIDGKSLMGLFAIDLTKTVDCNIHTDDPKQIADFAADIAFCITDK